MKKSVRKRIRITRTGKILRRQTSVNHFRTRKSQKSIRGKRKSFVLNHPKKSVARMFDS